jgi:hypothetical protein
MILNQQKQHFLMDYAIGRTNRRHSDCLEAKLLLDWRAAQTYGGYAAQFQIK